MMVLYLDLLFFTEWIIHTFLLYEIGKYLLLPIKWQRLILAGGVVSFLHCLWIVLWYDTAFYNLILMVGMLLLAEWIAFLPRRSRLLARLFWSGILVSAAFCGISSAVSNLLYSLGFLFAIPAANGSYSWKILAGSIAVGILFLHGVERFWLTTGGRTYACRVTVSYRGKEEEMLGFLDSGNRLREPKSGKGVSVLYFGSGSSLFTREEELFLWRTRSPDDWIKWGFYPVSFSTVGLEGSQMPAFTAEKVEVVWQKQTIVLRDMPIAISREGLDGGFDVLLSACFLEEGVS